MRRAILWAALAFGFHCASASKQATPSFPADGGDGGGEPSPTDFCSTCKLVNGAPKVALPASSELSGIAPSAVHGGVYYVHNDSGDEPRFFAIDETGAVRGSFLVTGAFAKDWEDIAVGPCNPASPTDGESCIFLADIGDNNEQRTDYVVYRVREPESLRGTVDVAADAFPFAYPDGSHDAEAFLVHPQTGARAIVTKAKRGPSGVYTFPADAPPKKSITLTRTGDITFTGGSPLATAGDVHPQGRGVLIRTYTHAWYFAGESGQPIEEMLKSTPCVMPVGIETQGESIAWMRSGKGYVTVSEGPASLHFARCD